MCGIVGLFIKNPALESELGSLVAPMLSEMTERGPDSAGIAVYRNPQKDGCKITVLAQQQDFDWGVLEDAIKSKFALKNISITRNHAVLSLDSEIDEVQDWVKENEWYACSGPYTNGNRKCNNNRAFTSLFYGARFVPCA